MKSGNRKSGKSRNPGNPGAKEQSAMMSAVRFSALRPINGVIARCFATTSAGGDYDLAIIGGGPGGYVAAIKAAQLGLKVTEYACLKLFRTHGLFSAFSLLCKKNNYIYINIFCIY